MNNKLPWHDLQAMLEQNGIAGYALVAAVVEIITFFVLGVML